MKKRRIRQYFWNSLMVLTLLLGVVGSMSAWEAGNIGLLRMLCQSAVFAALAYAAAMMGANVGRPARVRVRAYAHARPRACAPGRAA